ncbi:DUF1801 domain-containing protein [Mucilaginibacter limnophilus]|uniref:DUF1801 domain-containing protein n=1 Tax=Mucilaginibacter limnophilus TaxID=1932778 RepID=A0A437MYG7_9SPHI|nr:DUF1801 domain-containing protein [Mucilaginibacter limnophilus]RVU02730.1 DUF1801 domain-containing protein [Mucilaginibacter limnophilus]
MTLRPIDDFFLNKEEPVKSCLQALREILLNYNPRITEEWKYSMPFYCYNGKMFCYLWVDKQTSQPYIGVVEGGRIDHPLLMQGDRKRMKVINIDANCDIPLSEIKSVLDIALTFYK